MVLAELRRQCIRIVNGGQVEYELFYRMIDFVRNYADKYHHKKEENHLFNVMSDELGSDVRNGPVMGMLVEHDFGRAHIYDMEKALEACREGNDDARLDSEFDRIELDVENTAIRNKYMEFATKLNSHQSVH